MKRSELIPALLFALIIAAIFIVKSTASRVIEPHPVPEVEEVYTPPAEPGPTADWTAFIDALIFVESSSDPEAIGDGGAAVGVLQIHPCTVDECNRILGREGFTLEDRLSRERSIEMFEVIQNHYNPQHDIHLAAKVWNPRAPLSYHRRIIEKMNELKNKKQ